ncbi:MAG: FAD-dependent oxidoreductase [Gammaproteobacteria bacterium]|nr:FAD-dependent oxidoreductase [Gammaproteobacteria bacterium]
MQHVIIGAGPAGVIAAETLKKLDPQSNVTIVGDEPEPPYSRMAIPYYLINNIDEAGTYLRKNDGYFDAHGINIEQARVESIDSAGKSLKLSTGDNMSYDKLLVATGSHPTKPPIEGMDLPGVHSCWTLEDARHITKLSKPGAKVVLMGAGFIGCIILEALAASGVDLTVVEMENRMVPRMMNEDSGGLIKKWCESKNVRVLTTTRVTGISGGSPLDVALESGESIPADLVICATGVRPNTDLLKDTDVKIDHGILIDEHMRTSNPDIFAAGDVAQGKDFSTGEYTVQAIQPTAADHGRIAAANMTAGQESIHQGSVNMNVLDTMGLISASFGLWEGSSGGDTAELNDPDNYRYINLQFEDDVLVGANSLGLTQHVGVLRGLIQTQLHLGKWKDKLMDNPLNVMEAYLSATQGTA